MPAKTTVKKNRYLETVGRRKTAVARVRLTKAAKTSYMINGIKLSEYFSTDNLQAIIKDALRQSKISAKFSISALIKGGGKSAQAEACRHGIARALLLFDAKLKKSLKKAGFLKRDPRMKERKKFGLKKARRAPQWNKR
ncbi:MAG: 30S ribosomal protein S9 [Candidatus Pacebacteria bacterium]|nr:30S ribosomal protein S9 [Candidatus Paceibacterota bacterium]